MQSSRAPEDQIGILGYDSKSWDIELGILGHYIMKRDIDLIEIGIWDIRFDVLGELHTPIYRVLLLEF